MKKNLCFVLVLLSHMTTYSNRDSLQPLLPVGLTPHVVARDTMEPVCSPMSHTPSSRIWRTGSVALPRQLLEDSEGSWKRISTAERAASP